MKKDTFYLKCNRIKLASNKKFKYFLKKLKNKIEFNLDILILEIV